MKGKTMKALFSLLFLLSLVACASVQETYAPDGRLAYALNCSGTARGWDKCEKAAGDKCGTTGYDIISKSSEDVASGSGSNNFFNMAKTNERSMLIACKTN